MGKYTLLGRTVEFDEPNERFFEIQRRVWKSMDVASNDFNAWYDKCGDILTVLKGYEEKAADLVIKHANKPLFNELPQLEIYDMSEDSYDEECLIFDEFVNALDEVADAYNSIIAQQAAEEEYRAERKACRGRVVGGGFGVGGALKGMATASAMNAISGAGHSIVNAIGNAGSAAEAASAKRALYNNASVKALLRNGICNDILACYNAHIKLINAKKNRYYINCFDSDKAGALFQNAKKVPAKREELLVESFENCPWNEELLVYLFSNYKEEQKNVWDIARRFHVDLRKYAEETFANMYTKDVRDSEDKAKAVRKEILDQMQLLGITVSETVDRIEKDGLTRILRGYDNSSENDRKKMIDAVNVYDAAERNKSVVIREFGVWELAKKYHVRFTTEEVEKILGKMYTSAAKENEDEAQLAKKQIKTVMCALGVRESKTFDELETDCLKRLCSEYLTANEAACNEMLEKIREYDALDKNKKPYIYKIESRIEAIWSAEDGEIFDNIYLNTDIENAEEVRKAIEFVKAKKRTASAGKYLSALIGCNQENIKKARQFQQSTTNLIMYAGFGLVALGVIFLFTDVGFVLSLMVAAVGVAMLVYRSNLKKAWDKLTLGGTLVHAKISLDGQEKRISRVKTDKEAEEEIEKNAKTMMEIQDFLDKEKKGTEK